MGLVGFYFCIAAHGLGPATRSHTAHWAGVFIVQAVGQTNMALVSTIATSLSTAIKDEGHRDAALLTFLVTLSGLSIAGVGAAFWGLLVGIVALWALSARKA